MATHKQFKIATGVPVYFCDPASPWQRGSNQYTNGRLRQYFLKGTDLSVDGLADFEHIAQQVNGRPRKSLGWKTPAERSVAGDQLPSASFMIAACSLACTFGEPVAVEAAAAREMRRIERPPS